MRKASWLVVTVVLALVFWTAQAAPMIGGCQVFPSDNPWNTDITNWAVHPNSANYIANIMANGGDNVHPDFGGEPEDYYGIPWITVDNSVAKVSVIFDYDDESDPGPYPIPPDPPIEGGPDADGDRHIILVHTDECKLYELYAAYYDEDEDQWYAGSGAIFDLSSNALRPDGWTSADAAGLPILPGLAKCDEADAGEIDHAFRFTVVKTQRAYVYPATHFASEETGKNYPPMGLRLRLKSSYDLADFDGQALAIATALKRYGMLLADNGSNWYISGEQNADCWDDDNLRQLKSIPGTAFEVVTSDDAAGAAPSPHYFVTDQPTLTWNRVTGALGYEVQLSLNPSFTAPLEATVVNLFFTPPAPLENGRYYWRVRVLGSVVWSATESFVVNAP